MISSVPEAHRSRKETVALGATLANLSATWAMGNRASRSDIPRRKPGLAVRRGAGGGGGWFGTGARAPLISGIITDQFVVGDGQEESSPQTQ